MKRAAPDEPPSHPKVGMEAPSGFEPLHRSFADCSLSHLGTAPRECKSFYYKGREKLNSTTNDTERDQREGSTGISRRDAGIDSELADA